MDLDDGVTLRAADDPAIKNDLRRAWIADRLDERLGEFGETHAVDVVCAPRAVAAALTSLLSSLAVPVCASLPPLTGCDENNISQWAFDLLEALPNAHYNAFVYVLALLREVLAKSWQTTAATRLAAVARDAFLPNGEPDARAHVFAAVQFLLTSNL